MIQGASTVDKYTILHSRLQILNSNPFEAACRMASDMHMCTSLEGQAYTLLYTADSSACPSYTKIQGYEAAIMNAAKEFSC